MDFRGSDSILLARAACTKVLVVPFQNFSLEVVFQALVQCDLVLNGQVCFGETDVQGTSVQEGSSVTMNGVKRSVRANPSASNYLDVELHLRECLGTRTLHVTLFTLCTIGPDPVEEFGDHFVGRVGGDVF